MAVGRVSGSAGFGRAENGGRVVFEFRFYMLDDHWGKRMVPRRNSTGCEPKPSSQACPLTSPWETSSARGHWERRQSQRKASLEIKLKRCVCILC